MKVVLLMSLSMAASAVASPVFQEDQVEIAPPKTGAVDKVTVRNPYGNVKVVGVAGNSVTIHASKKANNSEQLKKLRISARTDSTGRAFSIDGIIKGGPESIAARHGTIGIDLTVSVPRAAKVEVHTWHGAATIEDIEDDAKIVVNRGNVIIRRVMGDVSSRATVGNQEIRDVLGSVSSESVVGDVEYERIQGRTLAGVVYRGDIRAYRLLVKDLSLWVDNGDITLRAHAQPGGRIVAHSRHGNVSLRLSRDGATRVRVRGSSIELPQGFAHKAITGGYVGFWPGQGTTATVDVAAGIGRVQLQGVDSAPADRQRF